MYRIFNPFVRKGLVLLFLGGLCLNVVATAQQNATDKSIYSIERNKIDNTPTSIFFSPETQLGEGQAQDIFKKYFGLEGSDNTMVLSNSTTTKSNITAKRYYQYYKGIKTEYGSVTLTCKEGRVSFVTGNFYNTGSGFSAIPSITENTAFGYALKSVGAEKYMWEDPKEEARIQNFYHRKDTSYLPHGQLVWIEDYSNGMISDRKLHLAYKFNIYAKTPLSRQEVFVDAQAGKILFTNNLIKHTAATGHSEYSGVIPFQSSLVGGTYELYDSTRGSGVHTMNMNAGTDYSVATEFTTPTNTWPTSTADTVALDAHWAGEMVYDYWKLQQSRLSWDNADGILVQYVHYDVGYNNAFWDGAEMTYGDGSGCGSGFTALTSLDVTAHEIGHGVCQATANLVYAGESGGLNEGFSDCWGATIENFANPHEVDAVPKSTWEMGEEIGCGTPLRRLDFPKLKGLPDTYLGVNWYVTTSCTPGSGNDQCGVHTNMGVLSKWYYLLTVGGSGTNDLSNAYSVTGLGFGESQDILYQTELVLASTADYPLTRTTSINVALTLYGPCSAEVIAVTNAWYAVGVGAAFTPCTPNIGFTGYSMAMSENAATTSCPASKVYSIGLKPFGPAFSGGNPTVNVFVAHGTAVAGVDYILGSASLTFPVGSTATQNATITVFDNGAVHDDKNLMLAFTVTPNGSNASVSPVNDSFAISINNDDSVPDPGHNEYHTLNAGSTVTSNLTSAFPGSNTRAHSQFLLYASQLAAAGVKPGIPVTQVAFNITTKNSTVPFVGYTVSMGNSTFADMSSIFATGLTQVYTGNHTTNLGMDSLDFNTSTFTWDGTSNVIVEICYGNNVVAAPANDQMDGIDDNPSIACDHTGVTTGVGTGCSLPYDGSGISTARPVMRFKQVIPPTAVETIASSTHTWDVKAGQEVYFYNTSDNSVMAGLKNTSNDLGCVTATVTQQGVGFTPAVFSPINRSLKEFSITPTINGATTTYDATIYFTNTELGSVAPSSVFLVKTDALTDAAVTTFNSVELTPTVIAGTNYIGFKGTFTGFSRFFLADGPICNTPVPVITPAGPTTFCTGSNVALNANTGAGLTYQWRNASGDISGATNSSYTASLAGNYTVKEYSGACNATSSPVTITLTTASVSGITGASGVCTGQSVNLSDATPGGTWASGNTSLAVVGTSGTVSGIAAGTTTISYSATGACGTATATVVLTVSTPAVVAAIGGTVSTCVGSATLLNDATLLGVWSSGNTALATVSTSGLVSGITAGSVPVSYSVTNASGCTSSAIAAVTVNAVPGSVITPAGSTVLCASGGSVSLNATSGIGFTYQWKLGGGVIPGATALSYVASSPGNYTVVTTNSNGCAATSAIVAVTISGAVVVPSVSIAASPDTIVCIAGTSVTYTPHPTNGGSFPAYQWYVNGALSGISSTYSYVAANGDVVACKLTSDAACATPDTAITSVTMTVGTYQTPSVSVTVSPGDVVCTGSSATFSAVTAFGGASPSFQWTKNGASVGALASYTYVPANGDIIKCTITSDYSCVTSATVSSSPIIMTVENPSVNKDSIYVTKAAITSGQVDTFVAIAPHGGTAPGYQWYINGVAVPGATNALFVTTTLIDGQAVTCKVTSSDICALPNTAVSNSIKVRVATGIGEIAGTSNNFTLIPNPNKGTFTINGTINNNTGSSVDIMVTDVLGQAVYKHIAETQNGVLREQITLPASLANGTYLVSVTTGEDHVVFHVVIDK